MECEQCAKTLTEKIASRGGRFCDRPCYDLYRKSHADSREVMLAKQRARAERYRLAHPEKVAATAKRYLEAHPDRAKAAAKRWREKNPEYHKRWAIDNRDKMLGYYRKHDAKPERISQKRQSHLLRTFGMSADDFDSIVASQGGICAACGEPEGPGRALRFVVDHCHDTGKVCGIIHDRCNRLAGIAKDHPVLVEAVAAYLRRTRTSDFSHQQLHQM